MTHRFYFSPFLSFDPHLLELVKSVGTNHLLQITLKWQTQITDDMIYVFLCVTSLIGRFFAFHLVVLKVDFKTRLLVIPKA